MEGEGEKEVVGEEAGWDGGRAEWLLQLQLLQTHPHPLPLLQGNKQGGKKARCYAAGGRSDHLFCVQTMHTAGQKSEVTDSSLQ